MQISTPSGLEPNEKPIPRTLGESPAYQPDWRHQVFERYVSRIFKAQDVSVAAHNILEHEEDFLIRELVKHHFDSNCKISAKLKYALDCEATQAVNHIAASVKALVVAGRTRDQIAQEMGTGSAEIMVFEAIFWDVRRYLSHRGWLQTLCYPELPPDAGAYQHLEATWLGTAFRGGFAAVAPCLCARTPIKPPTGHDELISFLQGCLSRASDYQRGLACRGVQPGVGDLNLFLTMARELKRLGFGELSISDLNYVAPLEYHEEKARREAAEAVKRLTPAARRRLGEWIQKMKTLATHNGGDTCE